MPVKTQKLYDVLIERRIMPLHEIMDRLSCSGMTAIRCLHEVGYLSSYSHSGKFYTLHEIAVLDPLGLWHYRDIHFSRWGTLKTTVLELIERSPGGYRCRELVGLLSVRCHNVLLDLTMAGRLHRERMTESGPYFYFSADSTVRAQQMAERRRLWQREASEQEPASGFPRPPIDPLATIAIAVELIKDHEATPAVIVHRLREHQFDLSTKDVRQVLRTYELDKKRAL